MATERGKIGRLKAELRDRINFMIRDNATAEEIIHFLEQQGVTGITPQNISAWKNFGFQKWLARTERIQEYEQRVEFAQALSERAKASGDGTGAMMSDTASQLAVDAMLAVLSDFNPDALRGLLAEKPEKFIELAYALSAIRKGDQAAILLRQKVEIYERGLKQLQEIADENGVATKDDIAAVMKEAYGT